MYLTKKEIDKFACSMERRFLRDYETENGPGSLVDDGYETNDLLRFMLHYPEANDRTKQRYYYLCKRILGDVPTDLTKEYNKKFGISMCGLNVHDSYFCTLCDVISGCRGLKHCFSCSDCRFSDHLLFCHGQRHASYMAFDKKVTKKRFAELSKMFPEELRKQPEYDGALFDLAISEITKAYAPRRIA